MEGAEQAPCRGASAEGGERSARAASHTCAARQAPEWCFTSSACLDGLVGLETGGPQLQRVAAHGAGDCGGDRLLGVNLQAVGGHAAAAAAGRHQHVERHARLRGAGGR